MMRKMTSTKLFTVNQRPNSWDILYLLDFSIFISLIWLTYVEQGTILNNYAHVFDLLLRLRQAVDHPYLVLHRQG